MIGRCLKMEKIFFNVRKIIPCFGVQGAIVSDVSIVSFCCMARNTDKNFF